MTIAEMDRLEHAARLSMGGLAETDSLHTTVPWHASFIRPAGWTLLAIALLAAVLKLA